MGKSESSNDKALEFHNVGKQGIGDQIKLVDTLGISLYSKALFEFIEESQTPMTIGVQGDWGMGKTSMMNMIRARLEQRTNTGHDDNYGIVWFNTWQFSMFNLDEFLGVVAISEMLELLKTQFGISENNPTLGQIKKLVSAISLNLGPVSVDAKKLQEKKSSLPGQEISQTVKTFKVEFKKLVKEICDGIHNDKKYKKIVFFIDDLDRVKPIKALELLETLKNFFDVKNCVFVLAVDYEVVQTGMTQKFGINFEKQNGKSFFDKIIQLPFVMPSSSYDMKGYLNELLSKIIAFNKSLLGKAGQEADQKFKSKSKEAQEKINKKTLNLLERYHSKAIQKELKQLSKNDGLALINNPMLKIAEEIVLLTVGNNPRSIKRVMNYLLLISKLNRGSSGAHLMFEITTDEPLIAFSIVCMQVAYPEIFDYFIEQPSPQRIRQIENWDNLDKIPNISKLYNRTSNVEQLKSNISGFFDELFDLLDKNNKDGEIDNQEFQPVLDVLEKCRFIGTNAGYEEPIDIFKKRQEFSGGEYTNFIDEVFKKSMWYNSSKMDFKMSGSSRGTLIYNRNQVGTLSTTQKQNLLFKLELNLDYYNPEFQKILKDNVVISRRDINLALSETNPHNKEIDENNTEFILEKSNSIDKGFGRLTFNLINLKKIGDEPSQINLMDKIFTLVELQYLKI
jgi:hypothetical protein